MTAYDPREHDRWVINQGNGVPFPGLTVRCVRGPREGLTFWCPDAETAHVIVAAVDALDAEVKE
jgi:hypothetical protein